MLDFFRDFKLTTHRVTDGDLRLRTAGSGPPLLLLHGNPKTHAMGHATAPALAERFTIVAPDLRGYGESFKAELMTALGHHRFQVAAHARVAHRLAIDAPTTSKAPPSPAATTSPKKPPNKSSPP